MKRLSWNAMISLAGTLAGCAVGPNYRKPHLSPPPSYGEAHAGPTSQPAIPIDLTRWWKTFNDAELNSLIERSVDGNLTLLTAEMRVREARAALGAQWANLFPTVDLSAEATRSKSSGNVGVIQGVAVHPSSHSYPLYQAGFDAGWEIDIFGGTRRAIESAAANVDAMVNARRYALVSLTAEVAHDYVALRGYQRQRDLTYSNLKTQQDSLQLTRSRFKAGLNSDLDVAQAEAQVATTAAEIPTLELNVEQTIHALSLLLGLDPMALADELENVTPIPPSPSEIPVGLPSELLRRRPDVVQAEAQLHQATANIGVAVAELFPKFSLTGSIGQETSAIGLIARSGSTFWSIGPTMSWRVFDSNQLINEVRVANAQQQEALLNYKQTVLQSFSDVEDALVAYAQDQNRTRALADAVAANQRSLDLSNELYVRGLGDFLNVLTAEQGLYTAQNNLAVSQTNVSSDLVQLFKAMGGGWDESDEDQFHKNEDPAKKIVMD